MKRIATIVSLSWLVACGGPPKPPHVTSPESEAETMLEWLSKNTQRYFRLNKEFVKGTAKQLPAQGCCGQPNNACPADPAAFAADPVWSTYGFRAEGASHFQYTYTSDGPTFHVEAIGDLDCDGTMVTYSLDGSSPLGKHLLVRMTPPTNED